MDRSLSRGAGEACAWATMERWPWSMGRSTAIRAPTPKDSRPTLTGRCCRLGGDAARAFYLHFGATSRFCCGMAGGACWHGIRWAGDWVWHDDGRRLHFASEVYLLLALLPRRPRPDDVLMAHWLGVSGIPGDGTLYDGIRRLEGASQLPLDPARQWPQRALGASAPDERTGSSARHAPLTPWRLHCGGSRPLEAERPRRGRHAERRAGLGSVAELPRLQCRRSPSAKGLLGGLPGSSDCR